MGLYFRICLLFGLGVLWGCASSGITSLKSAEFYFDEGMKALEAGRCTKAAENFQRIVTNYPGFHLVADAQYHLAEAHLCNRDYMSAIVGYQRVMDVYLSSKWVEQAQFKIAESYFEQLRRSELDQTETYEALVRFRAFIEDNPDSPLVEDARRRISSCRSRLAKKQYLNADLYFRQNHLEAAAITFKQVMRNYSDTQWYYKALARMGEIALRQEDPRQARTYWEEVLEEGNEDEKLKQKVRVQLKELELAQGG